MTLVIKLVLLVALLSSEWRLFGLQENLSKELEPLITFLGALATYLGAEFWLAKKSSNAEGQKKTPNPNDVKLYKEMSELLSESIMKFYQEHDFGAAFDKKYLSPLFEFVDGWDNAHREFVDPNLEKLREDFFASAKNLSNSIGKYTTTNRNGLASVVPDSLPSGPRPPHLIVEAKEMNNDSGLFHQKYEVLLRECKKVLH